MKQLRLSELGGYPFTQERLADMQSAYKEGLEGILAMGRYSENQGYIISGMTTTLVGDNLVIADGLFYYRGKIVRFQESSYDTTVVPGTGNAVMIVITEESTNLQMHDGSTLADAITELVASVDITTNGVTDDKFIYSSIKPWSYGFGRRAREDRETLTLTTPSIDGGVGFYVYYELDHVSNTLRVDIGIDVYNAQNLATAGTYIQGPRLPEALRPVIADFPTYFVLSAQAGTLNIQDSTNSVYLDQVCGKIWYDGYFNVALRRPQTGVDELNYVGSFTIKLYS
jgi:hypothetical protein